MNFPYNLHLHSYKSKCANPEMTLENIVTEAQQLGYDFIGISDHINTFDDSPELLLETRQELTPLTEYPVLVGVETTQLAPHQMSLRDEFATQFDYVIVAPDHYHLSGVEQPVESTPAGFAKHHLKMLEGAIRWPSTDIIAHPFLVRRQRDSDASFWNEFVRSIDRGHLRELLALAQVNDVAFEINVHAYRKLPEIHREMIEMGQVLGTRLAPATDAHKLAQLDFCFFFPQAKHNCHGPEMFGLRPADIELPVKIRKRIQG